MLQRSMIAGGVLLAIAVGFWAFLIWGPQAQILQAPAVYVSSNGVAINGYDPVAYFTEGAPVQGSEEFTATWRDVPWHFASAENRDMFVADPERYAPQYGGWCAFAMAHDAFASIMPEAWTVRDDKLYLNLSTDVRAQWLGDAEGFISRADENWLRKFEQAGS